ncbi:MAG TPA: S8 family serine peptidase, partial [Anaerolineae bacterium]
MSQRRGLQALFSVALLAAMVLGLFRAGYAAPIDTTVAGGPGQTDAPPSVAGAAAQLSPTGRYIVRLSEPPLAQYSGGAARLAPTAPSATGAARLDVNTPEAQAYRQHLAEAQQSFISALSQVAPAAQVQQQYNVVFNGLAVKVSADKLESLRRLPGVAAVTPEHEYTVQMDASLPLVGLGSGALGYDTSWTDNGLWQAVGGHGNAGKGLKIADIDGGISPENPCFAGAGYTYPAGFPKYDKWPGRDFSAFVNGKIIAARAYFRLDDPPVNAPTPHDDPNA